MIGTRTYEKSTGGTNVSNPRNAGRADTCVSYGVQSVEHTRE